MRPLLENLQGLGSDKDFPDITPRDAEAVREWQKRFGKTLA